MRSSASGDWSRTLDFMHNPMYSILNRNQTRKVQNWYRMCANLLLFDSAHGWGVWTTCAAWKSLINQAALQWAAWFVLDYSQWLVDWLTASWSWLKAATLFRISFSLPRSGISDTLPWRVSGNSRLTRLCWSPSWGHTLPSYFTKEEKRRGEKTDMLRYYNIIQYYCEETI